MARLLRPLSVLALILLALVAGCSKRVMLYAAPTTLPSGVHVRVQQAYVDDERLYVKMWLMNGTQTPIHIDRDGMSLRLPSGEVLPRSSGVTSRHNVYAVAPGQGHDVFVDFRASHDLGPLQEATVILGGISFGTDPTPRVAGELPLSTVYTPSSEPAPVMTAPPEGPAPQAPEAPSSKPAVPAPSASPQDI
jgi:hypothetical protein